MSGQEALCKIEVQLVDNVILVSGVQYTDLTFTCEYLHIVKYSLLTAQSYDIPGYIPLHWMGEKDEALLERRFAFVFRTMRIHGAFGENDDQTFTLECHSETQRC